MDETEDEPEVDPQYADDPQYWKEMKKTVWCCNNECSTG